MMKEEYARAQAAWAEYNTKNAARLAAVKAAFEKAIAENPLPEDWRIVLSEDRLALHHYMFDREIAGGDIFAHGESDYTGAYDWVHIWPDEAPAEIRGIYYKIKETIDKIKKQHLLPDQPAEPDTNGIVLRWWQILSRYYWVQAYRALRGKKYREMHQFVDLARRAEKLHDELPPEAEAEKAYALLQSLPPGSFNEAKTAVTAELRRRR